MLKFLSVITLILLLAQNESFFFKQDSVRGWFACYGQPLLHSNLTSFEPNVELAKTIVTLDEINGVEPPLDKQKTLFDVKIEGDEIWLYVTSDLLEEKEFKGEGKSRFETILFKKYPLETFTSKKFLEEIDSFHNIPNGTSISILHNEKDVKTYADINDTLTIESATLGNKKNALTQKSMSDMVKSKEKQTKLEFGQADMPKNKGLLLENIRNQNMKKKKPYVGSKDTFTKSEGFRNNLTEKNIKAGLISDLSASKRGKNAFSYYLGFSQPIDYGLNHLSTGNRFDLDHEHGLLMEVEYRRYIKDFHIGISNLYQSYNHRHLSNIPSLGTIDVSGHNEVFSLLFNIGWSPHISSKLCFETNFSLGLAYNTDELTVLGSTLKDDYTEFIYSTQVGLGYRFDNSITVSVIWKLLGQSDSGRFDNSLFHSAGLRLGYDY